MKTAIYIPTKDRPAVLAKTLRWWMKYPYQIYVVSEAQHKKETKPVVDEFGVRAIWLRHEDRGLGYSMDVIADHALKSGLKVFVRADDDHSIKGDLEPMLRFALRDDVLGVGVATRIYGLYMQKTKLGRVIMSKDKERRMDPRFFLHSGSMGYQCFAVNVQRCHEIGGFDRRLPYGEDNEFARRGMRYLSVPWYIYTGARQEPLAGNDRLHVEGGGGFASRKVSRDETILRAWKYMYRDWERYMTDPEGVIADENNNARKKFKIYWREIVGDLVGLESWPLENIETEEPWDWREE